MYTITLKDEFERSLTLLALRHEADRLRRGVRAGGAHPQDNANAAALEQIADHVEEA